MSRIQAGWVAAALLIFAGLLYLVAAAFMITQPDNNFVIVALIVAGFLCSVVARRLERRADALVERRKS